ncbi:MAG: hypothetical protein AAGB93_15685 [Planctomycetota bacterium]
MLLTAISLAATASPLLAPTPQNATRQAPTIATEDAGPINPALGGGHMGPVGGTMVLASTSGANIVGVNVRLDEAFRSSNVDFVANYTAIGAQPTSFFALDFDASATTLFGIDNNTLGIFTIDTTTGVETPTGVTVTGPTAATGLTASVDGSTWYLNTTSELWVGDITTGVFTLVGPFVNGGVMIDISIDSQGNLFGFSITDDSLYSINTMTGEATIVGGSVGLNANFAQGMDFDWSDDKLYATVYTGGGTGVFLTFNLQTGEGNFLNDTFPLNAEMEMAVEVAAPAPGSPIFGLNVRLDEAFSSTSDDFVNNYTILGPNAANIFALDFDASASTLYGVEAGSLAIVTIDTATGASTPTGQVVTGPGSVNGLAASTDGSTWYATTFDGADSLLYVGDIETGVFSLVGASAGTLFIDIAIDTTGRLYALNILDDTLHEIDPATGASTAIGTGIGFNANFAQGMDFDWSDNTLLATIYTGGGTGVFAEIDLTTGVANPRVDTTPLNAEMEMAVQVAAPLIGTPYCITELNSTGSSALLCATGSTLLSSNNATLHCTNLPTNTFVFFIASQDRDFVPAAGGGNGNLCLGGSIGRGVGGEIYNSGPSGTASAPVDWNAIPQPMGPVAGNVGETWQVQAWFRDSDMGMTTSNLSNGLSLTIE